MMKLPDLNGIEIRTMRAETLTGDDRTRVFALFDIAYRQANHAYLEKSLHQLRFLALADAGDVLAGFSLADMRVLDLPRLPPTVVSLAGMCCIDPTFRRRHLFGALEGAASQAAGVAPQGRYIRCGRMAHPASFRLMTQDPSAVPKPGVPITRWQQEVGATIAATYGVHRFDAETFVCIGSGEPIGYPDMEMRVEESEWEVFRPVNRDRGDSLLGMAWYPDAPEGW
ncbi:MAG: hypothetical protein M3P30_16305 [Chloroflexota bacterium]|nr:hypothetical protein [Chloroflexota bacterium]